MVVLENQIACVFPLKYLYFLYSLETSSLGSPHSWVKHGLLEVLLNMVSQFKANRDELSVCVSEFSSEQIT